MIKIRANSVIKLESETANRTSTYPKGFPISGIAIDMISYWVTNDGVQEVSNKVNEYLNARASQEEQ